MSLTLYELRLICPKTPDKVLRNFVEPLNAAFAEFDISTPKRQAAFLAQAAHESMGFVHTRELWGPTPAQERYDGRADLGNTKPEAIEIAARHGSTPGKFWKGHGLIQTTGFDNHCQARDALGLDCVEDPEQLMLPINAARAAGLFWKRHGLNELADNDEFKAITRRINGGLNGYEDRIAYHREATLALA